MRFLFLGALSIVTVYAAAQPSNPKFDVQGHRGARALMPENSVAGFIMALDSGVTTLEMDVVITRDRQVVLSHEPWMSAEICLNAEGLPFLKKEEMQFNIFQMSYEEVKKWDCGSKGNARFPMQQKLKMYKPLLAEVIVAVENHIKNFTKYEVDYNIELKSDPKGDELFHPGPAEFSDLVYQLVDQYLPLERVVIQSFDFRILKYWHQKYPGVRLAALIENKKSVDDNLADLGFIPPIYSPEFSLLSKEIVQNLHTKTVTSDNGKKVKVRVIPWTVSEEKDMLVLKGMGVDGLITDYPNRAAKFKQTLSIKTNGKK